MDNKYGQTAARLGMTFTTALLLATPAAATNGMFALGFSTNQRAMGGAGVAYGYEAMSATQNPALAASVGHQFQLGIDFFSPDRGYSAAGAPAPTLNGSYRSDSNLFPVPNVSYNRPLANGAVFNISMYGNGGMNTDFSESVFSAGPTGIDLSQLFISATYAKKTGNFSWGISPTVVAQRFQAEGLAAFGSASVNPAALTDNGYEWSFGYGLKAGVHYQASSTLSFGLAAQTKMNMSNFDSYAGLFENAGSFDIPASITAGVAWRARPNLTLMLDLQRIFYSGVPAISNAGNAGAFGAPNGAGFGWDNINVLKLGMEWKANDRMTWRAGYAYSENPLGPEDVGLGILAPGIVTHHLTAGGTYAFSDKNAMDFAIEYAPSNSVTNGPVTIDMSQISLSVGWTHTF
ncbi:MAG: outer membrane protein transport protein [Marinosulfonomonas sp.]|nr:outer membrane protein transport protein [Marinosulfonomonas sp.]